MSTLVNYFMNFIRNEEGQALSEYALIIALVVVGAIAALILLGGNVVAIFQQIAGAL